MPRTVLLVAALTLASAVPLHAQRRFRLGPAVSSMSLQGLSGASHSFTGYGGAVALITGDDGESGLSVIRYGDLGTDSPVRRLTLYARDSYYYPAGPRGIGPAASYLVPLSGPLRARSPFVGVRFRRDTKKPASSVGLEIEFAPMKVVGSCTDPGCRPAAILFAPGYEAGVWPRWGRVYGEVGFLLAGFYTEGPDRGIAQGLHGGLGCDLTSGPMTWNFNARLLWLQRKSGENVFGVQVGLSLSPGLRGKTARP